MAEAQSARGAVASSGEEPATGAAVPDEIVPGEGLPGEAMPGEAMPDEAMPGEAMPGVPAPRDPVGAVTVAVRYFAAAAEAAGREEELVTVAPTAGALRTLLADRYGPAMARVLEVGSMLVDGVVTRDPDRPLVSRVDVLPPFAGG